MIRIERRKGGWSVFRGSDSHLMLRIEKRKGKWCVVRGCSETLMDWAKRLDPNGKAALIVEPLSQTNEILTDMMFKEGNLPVGEIVTIRFRGLVRAVCIVIGLAFLTLIAWMAWGK